MFLKNFRISLIVLCALFALTANPVQAQGSAPPYPSKPIRLLVSGVGGAGDFAGRLLATELTPRLGQQVVIDNRPGGVTPGEILVKAQPDGYTLMMVGFVIWLAPFMRDRVPFDPLRDFTPVSLAISSPNVLVAHPSLRVGCCTGKSRAICTRRMPKSACSKQASRPWAIRRRNLRQ